MNHDFDFGPEAWPSQAPPSDFSDRCVSAMLDEPTPKSHRRWRGRGGTFLFLAAALCASSAWATGHAQASSPPAEAARFVPSMPIPSPEPAPSLHGGQLIELTPASSEPEDEEAPAGRPPAHLQEPPELAVPELEEPGPPPPPPFVMVPRCTCDQDAVVCSCF